MQIGFTTWINSLREVGSKATNGPWKSAGDHIFKVEVEDEGHVIADTKDCIDETDNAEFITLARNEWDTMLTLLTRYREALERMKRCENCGLCNRITREALSFEPFNKGEK